MNEENRKNVRKSHRLECGKCRVQACDCFLVDVPEGVGDAPTGAHQDASGAGDTHSLEDDRNPIEAIKTRIMNYCGTYFA